MGCDIHGWVEVYDDGKWIAIKELKSDDRNYRRFAALAGVRGDGGEAKGIPDNVSETAKYDIKQWSSDGHSHSYMPLFEAAKIFLDTAYKVSGFAESYPASEYFDYEEDDIDKARLVFWFDN